MTNRMMFFFCNRKRGEEKSDEIHDFDDFKDSREEVIKYKNSTEARKPSLKFTKIQCEINRSLFDAFFYKRKRFDFFR
jgi:hypothetical protein